jgi:hypothetical protein
VPVPTALYVDFLSASSYRAWRWLSMLEESAGVQVRPYLAETDQGEQRVPWDRSTPSLGLELLALGELARERGPEAHRRYVDAAFAAAHGGQADLSRPEAWLALATESDVDFGAFAREGERWRAEVGLWHAEAQDELGVVAVPTLVFDDEVALLLRLRTDADGVAPARRLLAAVAELAAQRVLEVRSTR